jgi:UDP-glucuronate decarboxylase
MSTDDDFTGPVNLGNESEFTIAELASLVIELTGSRSKIIKKSLPQDDPTQRRPDLSLARSKLGWEPTVALKDGLFKTIQYFDQLMNQSTHENSESFPSSIAGKSDKQDFIYQQPASITR